MTLLFFALSGLDLLGSLDDIVSAEEKKNIIEWIYAQQILPDKNDPSNLIMKHTHSHAHIHTHTHTHTANMEHCGFRGSSFIGSPFDIQKVLLTYVTVSLTHPTPSLSIPN